MKRLKKLGKYFLIIMSSVVITTVFIELLIRFQPGLTPNWYKEAYPPNGIEVFYPGVLKNTPIEGVPIPYDLGPKIIKKKGEVVSDLVRKGIVNPEENPDLAKYDEIEFRIDKKGFINPYEFNRPDIVFIGDSFTFGTGVIKPKGLLLQLSEKTNLDILSIAVPAIGPIREQWLLNNIALPLEPKAVIWFFFSANDIYEAERTYSYRGKNIKNHSQTFNTPEIPHIISLDIISKFISNDSSKKTNHKEKETNYLRGFQLETGNQKETLWFSPKYLKRLPKTMDYYNKHKGWKITRDVLLNVSEELKQKNIKFLVVYIPSKPEVYLPYVNIDLELLSEAITHPRKFTFDKNIKMSTNHFLQKSLKNRSNLEELLKSFCESNEIHFFSLRPELEKLAENGKLGFLSADTHWNEIGQGTAVIPIADWLDNNLNN